MDMNDNAKIYICTHTDFDCPVSHPVYEVADSRRLFKSDMAENGMDGLFYSELMTYHELAKHPETLPDVVGFCGYRKYYSFMDNVPDLQHLVEEHGCIATTPHEVKHSVYWQYAHCFFYADMDVMLAIVNCRYPWLAPSFNAMLEGRLLYTCNMFIMRRDDFLELMGLIWDALDAYLAVTGKDIRQRIVSHPADYLQKFRAAASVEHQYRIGGNLGERIASAFISCRFPNAKTYDIVFTEKARAHRPLHCP